MRERWLAIGGASDVSARHERADGQGRGGPQALRPPRGAQGHHLEVGRGEVMCMLGPSGSGKSTFLRCINHLEKINAGRLSVDGELVGYRESGGKLHELHEREIARKRAEIGMVFQHFNLFPHMTALENVTLAPIRVLGVSREEARERARRAARPGRARRQARHLPGRALRRPAAAGRDRPGAGDAAEADAVRRADLGARPGARRRRARRDAPARPRRDDDDRRHARDGLRARGRRTPSCSWTTASSSSPARRRGARQPARGADAGVPARRCSRGLVFDHVAIRASDREASERFYRTSWAIWASSRPTRRRR